MVTRMDADDVWVPGRLAQQVRVLADNPNAVLAAGSADLIDDEGNIIGYYRPARRRILNTALLWRNQIIHSSVIMRTPVALAVGGYPTCPRVEDYILWLRLSGAGLLLSTDQVWVQYRLHADQLTRQTVGEAGQTALLRAKILSARKRRIPAALVHVMHKLWLLTQAPGAARLASLWTRAHVEN